MTEWRPLSARSGGKKAAAFDGPHEGVPDWLKPSLAGWIRAVVLPNADLIELVGGDHAAALGETLQGIERGVRHRLDWSAGPYEALDSFVNDASDEILLDVADYLLAHPVRDSVQAAEELWKILDQAGSVWEVSGQSGTYELNRRVSVGIKQVAEAALSVDAEAGKELAEAWHLTYGRHPKPHDSYTHAIKAVEIVSTPVVIPKDTRATLGKVIKALKDAPAGKFDSVLAPGGAGVDAVVSMCEALWKGHRDRHGTKDTEAITQPEAEAALHLAATLVCWFGRGFVSMVEEP